MPKKRRGGDGDIARRSANDAAKLRERLPADLIELRARRKEVEAVFRKVRALLSEEERGAMTRMANGLFADIDAWLERASRDGAIAALDDETAVAPSTLIGTCTNGLDEIEPVLLENQRAHEAHEAAASAMAARAADRMKKQMRGAASPPPLASRLSRALGLAGAVFLGFKAAGSKQKK